MVAKSTNVFVRTSERTEFCTCRQRWWWAYGEKLTPRGGGMNALVFGSMVHRCLAEWYIPGKGKRIKRGRHPAETFDLLARQIARGKSSEIKVTDATEDKWVEACELGPAMMNNYVAHYGQDERYQIIYPEMPFQYRLHNRLGYYVCTYAGTTDALALDLHTGRMVLLEHKTAGTISTEHLGLDEQANTYWTIVPMWLWENGILPRDQDIDGMVYNFLRKSPGDDRPRNADGHALNLDGTVSKRQPPPLFKREVVFRGHNERIATYERILKQVEEMKLVRKGKLEVYKNPSSGPMGHCRFCEFSDICEMDETGKDIEELKKQLYVKWNPYSEHIWSLDLAA